VAEPDQEYVEPVQTLCVMTANAEEGDEGSPGQVPAEKATPGAFAVPVKSKLTPSHTTRKLLNPTAGS
jgi:hypothetical protein